MMIQSGHNLALVMPGELSWHVQRFGLINLLEIYLEQIEFSKESVMSALWNGFLNYYEITLIRFMLVYSFVPGRSGGDFKSIIFKLNNFNSAQNSSLDSHSEIARKYMPQNLTNEKPTLVLLMAWCQEATSHYLSQFWVASMWPYGITWPQWVDMDIIGNNARLLSFGPLRKYLSEIWIKTQQFSLKKIHLKILSGNRWPSFLSLNFQTHNTDDYLEH